MAEPKHIIPRTLEALEGDLNLVDECHQYRQRVSRDLEGTLTANLTVCRNLVPEQGTPEQKAKLVELEQRAQAHPWLPRR